MPPWLAELLSPVVEQLDPLHGVLIAVIILAIGLTWWWSRGRISRANRARQRVASRGESQAERLLQRAGFTIEERQVTRRWQLWVDGEAVEVSSRADLLVRRRGRRYVAEVKTGGRAWNPGLPATRRQLLEYEHVFDVHGLILVDMHHRKVRVVSFKRP